MNTREWQLAGDGISLPWFYERKLYHVTPLHYLPGILWRGELIASSVGEAFGITPRKTAMRRDRMLKLNSFVHLAIDLRTPLLLDKLAKGMPHAALVWQAADVACHHKCALLPYNTKAWRTKACYELISRPDEMSALMRRHEELGQFPSAEVLVERNLSLCSLKEIVVFRPGDEVEIERLLKASPHKSQPNVTLVNRGYLPESIVSNKHRLEEYYDNCIELGRVLPPPDLPFD